MSEISLKANHSNYPKTKHKKPQLAILWTLAFMILWTLAAKRVVELDAQVYLTH